MSPPRAIPGRHIGGFVSPFHAQTRLSLGTKNESTIQVLIRLGQTASPSALLAVDWLAGSLRKEQSHL